MVAAISGGAERRSPEWPGSAGRAARQQQAGQPVRPLIGVLSPSKLHRRRANTCRGFFFYDQGVSHAEWLIEAIMEGPKP